MKTIKWENTSMKSYLANNTYLYLIRSHSHCHGKQANQDIHHSAKIIEKYTFKYRHCRNTFSP